MKITSILLLLFVSVTISAQTPKQNQILFDFRLNKRGSDSPIPAVTQRNVLSKVFRKYLTDESKCSSNFDAGNSEDRLKALRSAGQIVPTVVDQVTGSFTAPGQTQTAYLIAVRECFASHAEAFGTKRMAIFNGNSLVLDVDIEFKDSILRKTDLDADGVAELLLTSSGMNQGIVVEMAALFSFKNGRLNTLEDFGQVTEDSCASGLPGSESTAAVLSYPTATSGAMPTFRIDQYKATCRRARQWRFKSTGKLS